MFGSEAGGGRLSWPGEGASKVRPAQRLGCAQCHPHAAGRALVLCSAAALHGAPPKQAHSAPVAGATPPTAFLLSCRHNGVRVCLVGMYVQVSRACTPVPDLALPLNLCGTLDNVYKCPSAHVPSMSVYCCPACAAKRQCMLRLIFPHQSLVRGGDWESAPCAAAWQGVHATASARAPVYWQARPGLRAQCLLDKSNEAKSLYLQSSLIVVMFKLVGDGGSVLAACLQQVDLDRAPLRLRRCPAPSPIGAGGWSEKAS